MRVKINNFNFNFNHMKLTGLDFRTHHPSSLTEIRVKGSVLSPVWVNSIKLDQLLQVTFISNGTIACIIWVNMCFPTRSISRAVQVICNLDRGRGNPSLNLAKCIRSSN